MRSQVPKKTFSYFSFSFFFFFFLNLKFEIDSLIREYEPNSVILAANVVNDCLFRLLDGTAHLEQLDLRLQDHQLKRHKSDNQEQVQWQDLFKESEQPIAWQELFQSKNPEESPIHEPVPEKEKEKEEESEDETTLDDQTLGGFGEMEGRDSKRTPSCKCCNYPRKTKR